MVVCVDEGVHGCDLRLHASSVADVVAALEFVAWTYTIYREVDIAVVVLVAAVLLDNDVDEVDWLTLDLDDAGVTRLLRVKDGTVVATDDGPIGLLDDRLPDALLVDPDDLVAHQVPG